MAAWGPGDAGSPTAPAHWEGLTLSWATGLSLYARQDTAMASLVSKSSSDPPASKLLFQLSMIPFFSIPNFIKLCFKYPSIIHLHQGTHMRDRDKHYH